MALILILLIILVILIFVLLFVLNKKFKEILLKYFGTTDFNKALEQSEITAEETPKSLSSMERLYTYKISQDFPDLNINELKSIAEDNIINCLSCIENKNVDLLAKSNNTIKSYIRSKIQDYQDKTISFNGVKVHHTVISKYENNNGIATIYFETGLEYFSKIGDKPSKKTQDRYKTEFIYIVDDSKVASRQKAIGLNCPNCGAPIKMVGDKYCSYCGSGIKDIVKRTWSLNNIKSY